jgi:hypothetical protein
MDVLAGKKKGSGKRGQNSLSKEQRRGKNALTPFSVAEISD